MNFLEFGFRVKSASALREIGSFAASPVGYVASKAFPGLVPGVVNRGRSLAKRIKPFVAGTPSVELPAPAPLTPPVRNLPMKMVPKQYPARQPGVPHGYP